MNFEPKVVEWISLAKSLPAEWVKSIWPAVAAFGGLAVILFVVGKQSQVEVTPR